MRILKKYLITIFLILLCSTTASRERTPTEFYLLLTYGFNSEYLLCGCDPHQVGGSARALTLKENLEYDYKPILFLDAGNLVKGDENPVILSLKLKEIKVYIKHFSPMVGFVSHEKTPISPSDTLDAVLGSPKIYNEYVFVSVSAPTPQELKAVQQLRKRGKVFLVYNGEVNEENLKKVARICDYLYIPRVSRSSYILKIPYFTHTKKKSILFLKFTPDSVVQLEEYELGENLWEEPAYKAEIERIRREFERSFGTFELREDDSWKVCGECHKEQIAIFLLSKHAHSLEALKRVGEDQNVECLSCHVFGLDLSTRTFAYPSLTCLSCHEDGLSHLIRLKEGFADYRTAAGLSVCLKCHTEEHSPHFDFEKYWKKIDHKFHYSRRAKNPESK